jgi:hypothetical protein
VWWITADSPASIEAGLAELTYQLYPDSQLVAHDREAARWAEGWLQAHAGWLLILDNVERRADVERLLGRLTTGHIIVTTRRNVGWVDIVDVLRLDTLPAAAAVELLLRLTGQRDEESATMLARELGYLPLALQQAGAYMRQTRIGFASYLEDLRRDPGRTLQYVAADNPAERAIARTWSVTMSQVGAQDPVATAAMNVIALLAPGDIPRGLLDGLAADRSTVDRALGILASYNMITLTESFVSTHRLVRSVIRGSLTHTDPAGDARNTAENLLADALYDRSTTPPRPRPNFLRIAHHVGALEGRLPPDFDPDSALDIVNDIEAALRRAKLSLTASLAAAELALPAAEAAFGERHAGVAMVREGLDILRQAFEPLHAAQLSLGIQDDEDGSGGQ